MFHTFARMTLKSGRFYKGRGAQMLWRGLGKGKPSHWHSSIAWSLQTPRYRCASFGRLFETLRQLLVVRSSSAQPFPIARVVEGLDWGEDFLGALSTLVGKGQKPWVRHW